MRAGLNFEKIIEAAASIADHDGLDNVTLTAVAKVLNVRKPSLYNHVDGLAELRKGLTIFSIRELKSKISSSAIGKAKEDAILAIAEAYRTFAHERPGLYRATVLISGRSDEEVRKEIHSLMQVMEVVLAAYALNDEERIHALRGLRSVMHGFVALEAAGWFTQDLAKEKSYHQLIDTFIRGLES